MDNNQKLISQIADLSRNLNIVNDSLKANNKGIESLLETQKKSEKNRQIGSDKNAQLDSISNDFSTFSKDIKEMSKSLSKMTEALENQNLKNFDFKSQQVKGSFQNGGVAKESGNYIVGENGKEIVTLPKGAGVIPINTKDLIEGLKKVPELSGLLKDGDSINVTGSISSRDRGILSNDGKKISLYRLIDNYEEDLALADDKDPEISKTLEKISGYLQSLEALDAEAGKRIDAEFNMIREERSKLKEKRGGEETFEDFKEKQRISEEIKKKLPPQEYNELGIAKAELEAEKMILLKKTESGEIKKPQTEEKAEFTSAKTDLKKSVKEPEVEKKESSLFSKISSSAGRITEGVAEKTGLGGVLSLAKKGIGKLSEKSVAKSEAEVQGSSQNAPKANMEKNISKLSPIPPKPEIKPESSISEKNTPTQTAPKSTPPQAAPSKQQESNQSSKKSEKTSSTPTDNKGISSDDLNDIKGALIRIASLLEGPLTVSPLDSPFRPDSRRI
jgi:hypothetical protein